MKYPATLCVGTFCERSMRMFRVDARLTLKKTIVC